MVRVIKHWNSLPKQFVQSPPLEILKTWSDPGLTNKLNLPDLTTPTSSRQVD